MVDEAAGLAGAVQAMGPNFGPDILRKTRELYRPAVNLNPAASEPRDLAYGQHPRQRADLYLPSGTCRAAVVFVHGGGFVGGEKNADGVFYCNVGRWLAQQGLAAVLPNYRLAPDHPWPAGTRDVTSVLDWAATELPRHALGEGELPMFVLGQSAGACHVANWLFDPAARGTETRRAVAGALLMSGFYRAEAPLPAGPQAYFGADVACYAERSPLTHVHDTGVPLWLSVAALDPPWIAAQSFALAEALTRCSAMAPQFHFLRGHNHVSPVHSLGTAQRDAGDEILRFISTTLAAR